MLKRDETAKTCERPTQRKMRNVANDTSSDSSVPSICAICSPETPLRDAKHDALGWVRSRHLVQLGSLKGYKFVDSTRDMEEWDPKKQQLASQRMYWSSRMHY